MLGRNGDKPSVLQKNEVEITNVVGKKITVSDWDVTKPSEKFIFVPCYDGFECAQLEVPMDRNNDDDKDKVVLAVIKLPAQVPVTDPRYGGAIFYNPGLYCSLFDNKHHDSKFSLY